MEITNEAKQKAALALNLCTVSVSQIVDYQDVNILQQEYDAILNNINLQEIIKDETLLDALKKILDTVTFYMIHDREKEILKKEYEQNLKAALLNAFKPGAIFVSGGPWTIAAGAAAMVGTGYLNYRTAKAQARLQHEKEFFRLENSAIEQLHGLRRSLFETAWRLSDTYDFPDEWRLTERQISRYNEILMEPDAHRRYDRLDVINNIFSAFPSFWYYKSRAALEAAHHYQDSSELHNEFRNKALEALNKYQEIYLPLMREDIIAAQAALDHIALLDPKKDKEQILQLLNLARTHAGCNYDVLQLCIINYLNIEESEQAILLLRTLINERYNVYLNGRILSRIYNEQNYRAGYDLLVARVGERNVLPWSTDMQEALNKSQEMQCKEIKTRAKELTTRYFELKCKELLLPTGNIIQEWQQETNLKKRTKLCAELIDWSSTQKENMNALLNRFLLDSRYKPIWDGIKVDDSHTCPNNFQNGVIF
ncbi:MAG: hypothetical protein HP023_14100 [Lachnospiraceae bacterium]|nr:hypothetical protein [Lachnospiraceae bacterium]